MRARKTYYKQMLIFIALSIVLGITTVYFATSYITTNNSKVVEKKQNSTSTIKERKVQKISDNRNRSIDEETSEKINTLVETLFNYDKKDYKSQINSIENMVSPVVFDKLKDGIFNEKPNDDVTCQINSQDYFWNEKSENIQSVIVDVNLSYKINKQDLIVRQIIKFDIEFQGNDMIVYDYLLLNNLTW